jgi:hypothetical protein
LCFHIPAALTQTRCLAAQFAHIVQLSAANLPWRSTIFSTRGCAADVRSTPMPWLAVRWTVKLSLTGLTLADHRALEDLDTLAVA